MRTIRETPEGPTTKVTILDAKFGLILQQRIYDPNNQLVATSTTGRYRRDPATGLFMPTAIQISMPARPNSPAFLMELQLGNVEINGAAAGAEQICGDAPLRETRRRSIFAGRRKGSPAGRGEGRKSPMGEVSRQGEESQRDGS